MLGPKTRHRIGGYAASWTIWLVFASGTRRLDRNVAVATRFVYSRTRRGFYQVSAGGRRLDTRCSPRSYPDTKRVGRSISAGCDPVPLEEF